jgi:hypothetical protein
LSIPDSFPFVIIYTFCSARLSIKANHSSQKEPSESFSHLELVVT